jgi:hypothetical protein
VTVGESVTVPLAPKRPKVPLAVTCLFVVVGAGTLLVLCGGGVLLAVAHHAKPSIEATRARRDAESRERRLVADSRALLDLVAARLEGTAREQGELPEMLAEAPPPDPWGTPLRYERRSPDRGLLRSAGPDRRFGTRDDVTRAVGAR